MHLLPCPHCQSPLKVSPSQAGDELACSACGERVAIPKLGQLRQLPRAEEAETPAEPHAPADSTPARGIGFAALGLIATASLLIAGFCALRWSLIEVSSTTDQHIEHFRTEYKKLKPAELIREYEQMEKFGLDMPIPFNYQVEAQKKYDWGRNAAIAGAVGGLAILGAVGFAVTGRRNRQPARDT